MAGEGVPAARLLLAGAHEAADTPHRAWDIELSINPREEEAPARAFSLLNVLTSAFTIKNLLLKTLCLQLNGHLNIVSEIGTLVIINGRLEKSILS